jgi:predicted ATPase/class 3 adenylate cyclase
VVRPSGTISLLFSDIEGSTLRWENAREEMPAALARHDALMRSAIEARGGYVFKTIGDAFCATFTTARNALEAALDAQHRLTHEDFSAIGGLRVRMALHSGTAEERGGDYFGATINRIARLLSTAHGGQIVVSASCAELLQGEMPGDCAVRDLGKHRLKDLTRSEHVYQVVAPGLPDDFPPLRSLDNLSNNLPAQLTSFVGRENEAAEIKSLLEQYRLVTLVGTGGAGKTRCAIQIGADLLDGSGDGVWLVELARISDPSLVASTVARALDVPEAPNRPTLDSVLAYLKRKRLLLIVDNCEHVIDEARSVIAAVLHGCPDVVVLATSREGLNIEGERRFRMPSLSTPRYNDMKPEELLRYGAPMMFADRAAAVDHRFAISSENARDIAEICRRLDGIPLAIELAAARTKVLTPAQLAGKLNDRFRVLTGGDRTELPRHQTMRALIDWSYDLLSPEEASVFRKLSVFAGTFSLESAADVCANGDVDEMTVLDLLASLVDKSLVQTEVAATGTRYRLLESTRQYARERLAEQKEYDFTARAHATTFLAKAETLERAYETTSDGVWAEHVEPELDNWRAALEWSIIARNDVQMGQRLAGATRWAWMFFSPSEGMKWIRLAKESIDGDCSAAVIANLDLAEATLNIGFIRYQATYEAATRALVRFEQIGDERRMAEAGWAAGRAAVFIGRHAEGSARLKEALRAAERLGLLKLTCWIFGGLCQNALDTGDLTTPAGLYDKALAIAKTNGFDRMTAVLAGMVAEYRFRLDDVETALKFAIDAIEAARTRKDRRTLMNTLGNMAAYLLELQRYGEAAMNARESLKIARETDSAVHVAISLQHLAAVAALQPQGDAMPAARLLGYVDMRLNRLQVTREYTEQHEYDAAMHQLRRIIGDDEVTELMKAGSAWTEDEAIAAAQST